MSQGTDRDIALTDDHIDLLAHILARKQVWRDLRSGLARRHALDFHVFEFLRADELGLSAVINWMLDPHGSHGQADNFLRLFLECFGIEISGSTAQATSATEVATHTIEADRRRIDIHVRCDDFILAVENKPYAGWQHDQVRDYLAYLEAAAPGGHCLVLLKGQVGSVPAEQLSPREVELVGGRLIDSDYRQLELWVRACAKVCEADRVRTFLAEFADYLDEEFGGGRKVDEHVFVVDAIRQDRRRTVAALELYSVHDSLLESVRKAVVDSGSRLVEARGWKVLSEVEGPGGTRESWPIYVDFGGRLLFAFVAQHAEGDPYFGLRWKARSDHQDFEQTAFSELEEAMGGCGKKELWWPWWRFAERNDMGFSPNFVDTWTAMLDAETFALRLLGLAERSHHALSKAGLTPPVA